MKKNDCPVGEAIDPEVLLFAAVLKIEIPAHGSEPKPHIALVPQLTFIDNSVPVSIAVELLSVLELAITQRKADLAVFLASAKTPEGGKPS